MNIQAYEDKYHNKAKFVDNWMEGIKFLPFTSNPSTAFDKKCSLHGIVGEYFRLWEGGSTQPLDGDNKQLEEKLESFLKAKGMRESEIELFCKVVRDVLFVDGNLNFTDSAFLKYLPYLPFNNSLESNEQKKYMSGEMKMAHYLYSMRDRELAYPTKNTDNNLFINVLRESFKSNGFLASYPNSENYYVLPFIKASFASDFKWLMEQEEIVKCKYIGLFFYFYACYSVVQSVLSIKNNRNEKKMDSPVPIYFMLASEKASSSHDAVQRGWQKCFPKGSLEHLFGEVQAIDIANSLLGGNIGLYPELMAEFNKVSFEENKAKCEYILQNLKDDKIEMFSHRNSESADGYQEIDLCVESYVDFLKKLRHICVGMQSPSYNSRIKKKVTDLLGVRFLKKRREYQVLALDNEMLLFLIAMITRNEKTKLEDMYKKLLSYGICLNRGTRLLIEDYLLDLNLLDRKSDSGEAQYVKVVL